MDLNFTKPSRLLLFATYILDVINSRVLWLFETYAIFGAVTVWLGGSEGALVGALLVTPFILALQFAISSGLQSRWQYIVFSADRYDREKGRLWALERHLHAMRSFLEVSLGDYCDELLAASSHDLERFRTGGNAQGTLGRLLRGVALEAQFKSSLGEKDERTRFAGVYASRVQRYFSQSSNPRVAARDFLVEYFHEVDEGIKRQASQWEPPLKFLDRLEKHATLLQVVAGLVGALITLYFAIRISGR